MAVEFDGNKYALIDRETGEMVETQYDLIALEPGDTYRTKEQNDFVRQRTKSFKKGCDFVKVYKNAVKKMTKLFKNDTKAFATVYALIPYVSYDSILMIGSEFATISKLAKVLEEDRGNFNRTFNKLIQNGIIAKTTVGKINGKEDDLRTIYVANPYVYSMGTEVLLTAVHMFEGSGWDTI